MGRGVVNMEIKKKGKNTRIIRVIYNYLLTTYPKTIREIEWYLKSKYKHFPDYHGLSTIMGNSGYFKKVGHKNVEMVTGGYYKSILWSVD